LLDRTALSIRVQTGCEEQCSYCIIPYTRGKSTSRRIDELVTELQQAEASGVLDVTLTGVHLGAYGRDLTPPSSLDQLLRAAADATNRLLIRLGSLEPTDAARAIDLAEQDVSRPRSICAAARERSTAARMRRPPRLADYRRTVDHLRERLLYTIGSDIIVGTGETDADVDRLCDYLDHPLVLTFSALIVPHRATALAGKVPGPVIRERGCAASERHTALPRLRLFERPP
jgi:threonylcarbamoyladenosine tRNA methylthiotransferase MtaB